MKESKQNIKVLLIEDDQSYADLVMLKLSNSDLASFTVEQVGSLADFRKKIPRMKPDIILTDLGLSDSEGLETFRQVFAAVDNIPIVVLTGDNDTQLGLEAVRQGAQDYLVKIAVRGDLLIHSILHAIERNFLRLELKEANKKLELLSMTDPLTGLLNRRGLDQVLPREAAFRKRYRTELYVVMIDLDDFKSINEEFGHSTGDLVLQRVAESIRSVIRPTDYAARIGGDEFLVLLVQAKKEHALKIANRLRKAIDKQTIPGEYQMSIHTTASAGVMDLREGDFQLDHLIKKAGSLLKQSKVSGKNRVSAQFL